MPVEFIPTPKVYVKKLERFKYEHDEAKVAKLELKKGQTYALIEILKQNPGPWTQKDLSKFIEDHPRIHTSSPYWRIVNVIIWRLKKVGLIRVLED